jgi:hypothetical protein
VTIRDVRPKAAPAPRSPSAVRRSWASSWVAVRSKSCSIACASGSTMEMVMSSPANARMTSGDSQKVCGQLGGAVTAGAAAEQAGTGEARQLARLGQAQITNAIEYSSGTPPPSATPPSRASYWKPPPSSTTPQVPANQGTRTAERPQPSLSSVNDPWVRRNSGQTCSLPPNPACTFQCTGLSSDLCRVRR